MIWRQCAEHHHEVLVRKDCKDMRINPSIDDATHIFWQIRDKLTICQGLLLREQNCYPFSSKDQHATEDIKELLNVGNASEILPVCGDQRNWIGSILLCLHDESTWSCRTIETYQIPLKILADVRIILFISFNDIYLFLAHCRDSQTEQHHVTVTWLAENTCLLDMESLLF